MRNLVSSYSAPYRFLLQSPSFFFVFLVSSVELLNELTRRRLLRSRETDGQEKPALSFKKIWKWCPPLYFQFSSPHCAPDSWTFFIKTFCCRRLLSYHFVMVLLSSHYLSRPVCLCWGFELIHRFAKCIVTWWSLSWHTNTGPLDRWRHRFRKALWEYCNATVKLLRIPWQKPKMCQETVSLTLINWHGNDRVF